jgi:hypothetical protein
MIAYTVLAVLFIFAFFIMYIITRSTERRKWFKFYSDPKNIEYISFLMIEQIKRNNKWDQLESMRSETRLILRKLDNMRHDVTNKQLRDSKKQIEIEQQTNK